MDVMANPRLQNRTVRVCVEASGEIVAAFDAHKEK
jgi:hypothetical protein